MNNDSGNGHVIKEKNNLINIKGINEKLSRNQIKGINCKDKPVSDEPNDLGVHYENMMLEEKSNHVEGRETSSMNTTFNVLYNQIDVKSILVESNGESRVDRFDESARKNDSKDDELNMQSNINMDRRIEIVNIPGGKAEKHDAKIISDGKESKAVDDAGQEVVKSDEIKKSTDRLVNWLFISSNVYLKGYDDTNVLVIGNHHDSEYENTRNFDEVPWPDSSEHGPSCIIDDANETSIIRCSYIYGIEVEKCEDNAFDCYQKIAYIDVTYNRGCCYDKGVGAEMEFVEQINSGDCEKGGGNEKLSDKIGVKTELIVKNKAVFRKTGQINNIHPFDESAPRFHDETCRVGNDVLGELGELIVPIVFRSKRYGGSACT
ncbi:hypothetical protein F8M41_002076 [Gigaspora margarita]|uniref:Uncharacterized protein n=1 Tax=Gigaspora margarita TaxID=4874 RepID=A0A8H3XDF1_GIGMA|nr:hypothetical protein F8M41_002076 [Gigaspora margarita]